ncbi:MAG: RNA polymerase sigma factor [Lachnospiraceae bacterium]|nr:RNA polymerase sigma factor [Lachnospiraceae bacterium]
MENEGKARQQAGSFAADNSTMPEGLIENFTSGYMEKLFYFCLKKTGNPTEAEDLASDIALNIIAALRAKTVPEHFSAWVWRIARNRYSRWADAKRRRQQSVAGVDINDCEEFLPAFPQGQHRAVEEILVHGEELSLLRRELAFIVADYRQLIVAFYLEDTKAKDIAAALCVPIGTVLSKLSRARKILKEGMSMAREFGTRSYQPEEVDFASSGSQPSGLPWSAVGRKIPKNILLEASNNPSTIQELSVELGIAAPYIEEEVDLLVWATLLKKMGEKYVTDFFILSKECQQEIYAVQRENAAQRGKMIEAVAADSLADVRALGIAGEHISDNTIKWWLMVYCIDYYIKNLRGYKVDFPYTRTNGEDWGFIGYEKVSLPENLVMGHCGSGDSARAMFWTYQFNDYGMWQNPKILSDFSAVMLLADVLKNKRKPQELSDAEKDIWRMLDGEVAHVGVDGFAVADILVISKGNLKKVEQILAGHPLYAKVMENMQAAFDATVEILKKYNTPLLNEQFMYCASMKILDIRMMLVHGAVESGALEVPEETVLGKVGMWLEVGD